MGHAMTNQTWKIGNNTNPLRFTKFLVWKLVFIWETCVPNFRWKLSTVLEIHILGPRPFFEFFPHWHSRNLLLSIILPLINFDLIEWSNWNLVPKCLWGWRIEKWCQKYLKENSLFFNLKIVSAIFYQIFIFSSNDSPSKTVKNVFYFI